MGDSGNCLLTMMQAGPISDHSHQIFIDLLRYSNVCSTVNYWEGILPLLADGPEYEFLPEMGR